MAKEEAGRTRMAIFKRTKNKFAFRVMITLTVFIFISVVLIFLFVYRPLKSELEKSLLNNFEQFSNIRYASLENNINQGLEGGKSMSSRSVIRDAIVDYKEGSISIDELRFFHENRYEDGARALENLLKAERYVDNMVIASYITDGSEEIVCDIEEKIDGIRELTYRICLSHEEEFLIVMSPISAGEHIVGHDLLLFTLKEQIHSLCTEDLKAQVLNVKDIRTIEDGAKIIEEDESFNLLHKKEVFYKVFRLEGDKGFVVWQTEANLFEPIRRSVKSIIWISLLALLVYSLGIHLFIVRYAETELSVSFDNLKLAMTKANTDSLTGVYSRGHGEELLDLVFKKYQAGEISPVVMLVDVDSLKQINDKYGHSVGDLVIRAIARALTNAIRRDDMVIRWGGDEFIVVFPDLSKENSKLLGDKLLKSVSDLSIGAGSEEIRPTISIGISYFLDKDNNLMSAINRADQAMYHAKSKGKNSVYILDKGRN